MNIPYVKEYKKDKDGVPYLANPIEGAYNHRAPNRSYFRRKPLRKLTNRKGMRGLIKQVITHKIEDVGGEKVKKLIGKEVFLPPVYNKAGELTRMGLVYFKPTPKIIYHVKKVNPL